MTEQKPYSNAEPMTEPEDEIFPVEPRYHPIHKIPRKIYDFLASAKLAMALLVIILVCCVSGVTIWRGREANVMVFDTTWFNAILVLLVINVACCFFGRIWGRRVTLVSFGMILFHLSFVVILLAIVYNSLFYFRGTIRLTEGEKVSSGEPLNYDQIDKGRFFNFSRLKGETALIKLHTSYKVFGEDKRAAYEIEIGEEGSAKRDVIFVTHKLSHNGFDYFNDREGYSILLALADKLGKDIYRVFVPLQSVAAGKDTYNYATGYRDYNELVVKKDVVPFPPLPEKPLLALQTEFLPSKLKELSGDFQYLVYSLDKDGLPVRDKPLAEGKAALGEPFVAGNYVLTAQEVRYWVGMLVRYEPGKLFVMISLWVGLAGMVITTAGRMFKKK